MTCVIPGGGHDLPLSARLVGPGLARCVPCGHLLLADGPAASCAACGEKRLASVGAFLFVGRPVARPWVRRGVA